jgi:small subunit ribosomal protein S20
LIDKGDLDSAKEASTEAMSVLDKAAKKGAIHPSNAARRKSRLMKKLNSAQAASQK